MQNPRSDLQKLLDVNIPIVYIDDFDYARIDEIIRDSFNNIDDIDDYVSEWNAASGEVNFCNKELIGEKPISLKDFLRTQYELESPGIILLRDIAHEIEDNEIISLLLHISQRKLYDRDYHRTIIISDYTLTFPSKLLPYVSFLNIPIPDDNEINRLIREHLEVNGADPDGFEEKDRDALMPSLRGLSLFEIDRVIDMAMSRNGSLDVEDKEMILQQKKAQVRKSGLIDLVEVREKLSDIGGLDVLKRYLRGKALIMSKIAEANKYKISTPKGIFIVGMPGCGKSLCAKAAATTFNCPLLKLDMGSLMGKYVGQSEANLRRVIKIAEATAPCILWIDEIEKGFSGVGGNNDIMTRMFGYFLSWMQDKKSSVYVIATANNANCLPPELKRKGRFDEIFCVNLPNKKEREEIFKVHLKNKNQNNVYIEDNLLNETDGFNGADIESVVNEALEQLFIKAVRSKQPINEDTLKLTNEKLLEVAKKTVSIYKSCNKQIENMVKIFADSHFTNASTN